MLVDLVPVAPGGPGGDAGGGPSESGGDLVGPAGPDLRPFLGGGPFNVAVAAGRQGADVAFLSRMSTDGYGRAGLDRLAAAGVGTSLVQRGDEPTTLALPRLDADGAATYDFHWRGCADGLVEDPGPLDADVVVLGTCSLVFEPGATVYETVLVREAGRGRVVALDPNIRPAIIDDAAAHRERFRSWLPHVTVLKLSDADLTWLLDDPGADVRAACRDLVSGEGVDRVAGAVILTEGPKGATIFTADGEEAVAAPEVTVADTIGAGDTIMGTVAAEIDRRVAGAEAGAAADGADGATPADIVRAWGPAEWRPIVDRAVRAAAITVSRAGANPPTRAELDGR